MNYNENVTISQSNTSSSNEVCDIATSDALLTPRELQILKHVAAGWSAKEVARRIDIAPRTVERHIENIREKLGARNTTHMVSRAFASGMLSARRYAS